MPPLRLSPLPVVGDLKRPHYLLKVGSVDVLLTVLGDLPGLSAIGVGDAVDTLDPNVLEVENRFGDEHRVGVGGTDSIVAGQGSLPVPILADDGAIDPLPDLGVTVLYGEGVADIPGSVVIGGLILPGSGGADNVKEGHLVSVRLVCFSLQGRGSRSR